MIKEANFSNFFSDSIQTMGRNLVKFLKILMMSSLVRKYDVIIVILMSQQVRKRKVYTVCLFLDGVS